jgi:hypothetical protein
MSPTLLATLRRVERDTRQLAESGMVDDIREGRPCMASYPRDYYRPAELAWRWRGVGRFAS